MKFREYGEVKPITISTDSKIGLDKEIEKIGRLDDIIDLQFATSYDKDRMVIVYSALLLVKVEEK